MPAVKWCPRVSWLQVAVMIVLCGAAFLHYLPLPVGGFFLLGLQSAIMSPARRGFAKEVAGENVGWMAQFKTSTPLAIGVEAFPIDGIAADPAPTSQVNFSSLARRPR
jgi:hypothetical protein